MRLLFILFIVIATEAKKKWSHSKQNRPTAVNVDDDENFSIDVLDQKVARPVNFGHIFKEGHEDPMSDLNQPLDLLELYMKYPANSEEARFLLQNTDPKNIQRFIKVPEIMRSPRDEYLYRRNDKLPKEESGGDRLKTRNDSAPLWFDLPALQMGNLIPKKPKFKSKIEKVPTDIQKAVTKGVTEPVLETQRKMNNFNEYSFNLQRQRPDKSRKINWTNCDEFGRNAKFHPKDIVDIPWVPFFVWDDNRPMYVKVHTFSFPKKTEVKFYKDEYSKYLNITLDWHQPKLIMKTQNLEMLLIASDRKGLFDGILRYDIPEYVKRNRVQLPMEKMRLKTIGAYLAMMHCNYNSAKILAVSGEEPATPGKKLSEAKYLNFRGRGGPVSRNLQMERMAARRELNIKIAKEEDKILISDEPIPPLF